MLFMYSYSIYIVLLCIGSHFNSLALNYFLFCCNGINEYLYDHLMLKVGAYGNWTDKQVLMTWQSIVICQGDDFDDESLRLIQNIPLYRKNVYVSFPDDLRK